MPPRRFPVARFCALPRVNAPFSCPNNSLSSNVCVSADTLIATKDLESRGLLWCNARAANSCRCPIRHESERSNPSAATFAINRRSRACASLSPTHVVVELAVLAQAAVFAREPFDVPGVFERDSGDSRNDGH